MWRRRPPPVGAVVEELLLASSAPTLIETSVVGTGSSVTALGAASELSASVAAWDSDGGGLGVSARLNWCLLRVVLEDDPSLFTATGVATGATVEAAGVNEIRPCLSFSAIR